MNSAVYVYMTLSILYKPGNGACIMYIKTVFNKKTCGQAYLSLYLAHTHTHSHTLTCTLQPRPAVPFRNLVPSGAVFLPVLTTAHVLDPSCAAQMGVAAYVSILFTLM